MNPRLMWLLIISLFLVMSCISMKKSAAPVSNTQPATANPAMPNALIPDGTKNDMFMEKILNQYPQFFAQILENRKDWNVQVIYTEINRNSSNQPSFKNHYFNVNSDRYFYPASTVKLPVAALALQRLNEMKHPAIGKYTTMLSEAAYPGQTEVINDPTTEDGRPNIAQYIKKILLVSDNDAFNRLYEFLGQEYINEELRKKGYPGTQILHRLNIFLTEDENRHTNPVKFIDDLNNILLALPMKYNEKKYSRRTDSIGKAYYRAGKLMQGPMEFSKKNRISLEDLHNILRSLIFPSNVPGRQRFNLKQEDYKFLQQYMSQFPSETLYPAYHHKEFRDAYGKFLFYGGLGDSLPKNIRIFNKIGDAYGQALDIAYIVDFDKNIEFFLSAVIYANKDGVMNDDKYDYETIAFPFLANLGKVFYDYDLNRERKHIPDLSDFKLVYDK